MHDVDHDHGNYGDCDDHDYGNDGDFNNDYDFSASCTPSSKPTMQFSSPMQVTTFNCESKA